MRSIRTCVATLALAFVPVFPTLAQPVLITAPKTVGPLDTTITPTAGGAPVPLSTAAITVQNTTITVNGRHTIASLDLVGTAVLNHAAAFSFDYSGSGTDIVNGTSLTTTTHCTVGTGTRIDVSGLGHAGGAGTGAGQNSDGISPHYAGGGGYGGSGESVFTAGGGTYGSFTQPSDFGSGGGNYGANPGNAGGAGGGCVRLTVGGTLTVDGTIRSNGGAGGTSTAGRGAGGSLWISTASLAGSGIIEANGGATSNGGAGGGGRIALSYDSTAFVGASRALGTSGSGTGTVYIAQTGQTPVLIFDNSGISNRSEQSHPLNVVGNLVIRAGVGLSHPAGAPGLSVTVSGDAIIDTGGVIDATGRGHAGGAGPGAGQNSDGLSPHYAGGGGYGGNGESVFTSGGGTYGSFAQPTDLGSGGGNYGANPSNAGGTGGGAVRLIVGGALTVNGTIRSNGGLGGTSTSGRGAGGSVWITTGSLAGSGIIEASGAPSSNGGAGGGGRVAVYYDSSTFVGATRAVGTTNSGTGTVYLADTGEPAVLIFDNLGVTNRTDYSQALNVTGNLIVRGGVGLGHPLGSAGLSITVSGNATVENGGSIDASARGHPGGTGPGAGQNSDGISPHYAGGGGYGGNGETVTTAGGGTYGSFTQPTDLGSGGGNYGTNPSNAGGTGGGAIRMVVGGTLTVNGTIRSNGGLGGTSTSGRGAGGSVWITTGILAGSGIIEASGGPSSNGGAGGGGRIAIYYDSSSFVGIARAPGTSASGTGTVYLADTGEAAVLIFDNFGVTNRTDYSQPLNVNGNLIVRGGVGLGHPAGASGLVINVTGAATVENGGVIDASARGHAGGSGPGAGQNSDGISPHYAGGGGYGGAGESVFTSGGNAYGSSTQPSDFGSGGGNYGTNPSNAGGAGGGAIRLNVGGTLTVNGTIRSNGGLGGSSVSGRGSGGGVWITAGSLTGSGIIEANGGPTSNGGAGGGGRVAVYSCNFLMDPSQVRANRGGTSAGHGTVHLATATAEVFPSVACLGETITFHLSTVGTNGPFQWRHDGNAIVDGPAPGGTYSGATTDTLVITGATRPAGGEYDCLVSGSCGGTTSNAVTLLVDCCPDVNCDGNVDGFDVETMARATGGDMTDFCQADPDFNGDGNLDGFDVEAVELVTGGGPCP